MGVALLLAMTYIAIKVAGVLKSEAAVILEFYRPNRLRALVSLYPVAALLVALRGILLPSLPTIICALAFFTLAYLAARNQRLALERSGTDRTSRALSATSTAETWAIIGGVVCALAMAVEGYAYYMSQPVRFE